MLVRPDSAVLDPNGVRGRGVGHGPHDLDPCAFSLDRGDQSLAQLELLGIDVGAAAKAPGKGQSGQSPERAATGRRGRSLP